MRLAFADLSLDIPGSTCSGTYTVTVVVKNSAGVVLASANSKFTVTIPTPLVYDELREIDQFSVFTTLAAFEDRTTKSSQH